MDERTRKMAESIKGMSVEELASFMANKLPGSIEVILGEKEFDRQARVHQHELDRKLIAEQVQWMKFTAVLGPVATLIGAIAGALLLFWLQNNPQPKQPESPPRPAPQQSGASTSVDRLEKAVSVPSDPPLKSTP